MNLSFKKVDEVLKNMPTLNKCMEKSVKQDLECDEVILRKIIILIKQKRNQI